MAGTSPAMTASLLRVAAVAVLVFFSRAARTGLVASDLAPARRIVRLALHGNGCADAVPGEGVGAGARQRKLVLSRRRIDLVRLHIGQRRRLLFGRWRAPDLDAHQLRGDRLAQIGAHGLEQSEGFRLVLVERIALPVAAQAD